MLKLPYFGKQKLELAFEYGIILADVLKSNDKEITKEIVQRMEKILVKECTEKSVSRVALDMIPNILACLEPSDTIKASKSK
jgi:hypothetical protein